MVLHRPVELARITGQVNFDAEHGEELGLHLRGCYHQTTGASRTRGEAAGESLHPEQAKAIIELAQDPWRAMFAIAAYAGLRAGEILGLSVDDVDLPRGVLNIRKTAWYGRIQTAKSVGSENTIPIAENLAEIFRRVIGERQEGLLFMNKAGRAYTSSGKVVQKRLWPLCDALKIPRAGFHAFRHMHATILLETGATPKVAQRRLRHADSLVTLDHYAHLIDSSHREAVKKAAAFLDRCGPKIEGSVN